MNALIVSDNLTVQVLDTGTKVRILHESGRAIDVYLSEVDALLDALEEGRDKAEYILNGARPLTMSEAHQPKPKEDTCRI